MKNKSKFIKLVALITLFMSFGANAQYGFGTSNPSPSSVIDMKANDKGFLPPRLTTAQRNAIASPTEGLTVFNTDTQCLEVYKVSSTPLVAPKWDSYCDGRFSIATFTSNCGSIVKIGNLIANQTANGVYIELSVDVTQIGTYTINSDTKQGIKFNGSGIFFQPGVQTIRLFASGTAVYGGGTPTTFTLDNSETCTFSYTIQNDKAVYVSVNCSTAAVQFGKLRINEAAGADDYIEITLNVTIPGPYNFSTNTANGVSYSGTGNISGTGSQVVRLNAVGTPLTTGTTNYTVTDNLSAATVCNNLSVLTSPYNAEYTVDCSSATIVFGTYKTNVPPTVQEKVYMTINVTSTGNYNFSVIDTDSSGLTFSTQSGVYTSTGTKTVVFSAITTPIVNGVKNFTIKDIVNNTVCTFQIAITESLGGKTNPGSSCLAIKQANPSSQDGEYWIETIAGQNPVKTLCDMTNGGWTLVWSYSENTNRADYGGGTTFTQDPATYRLSNNLPRNASNYASGIVDYTDFRTSKQVMQRLSTSNEWRVRIALSPTNVATDTRTANDYLIVNTSNVSVNFLSSSFDDQKIYTVGKIFGYNFSISDGGNPSTLNGSSQTSGPGWYSGTYASHLNWSPAFSGTVVDDTYNNMFGWYGETQPNHHFGKCPGSGAPDTGGVTTCAGSTLLPHNVNSGEGYYLQWFIR